MNYTCPVCGFDSLRRPPKNYSICPCCSTEFGTSDFSWTHDELRQQWIASGAPWSDKFLPKPSPWTAIEQLRNIGYFVTDAEKRVITPAQKNSVGWLGQQNYRIGRQAPFGDSQFAEFAHE